MSRAVRLPRGPKATLHPWAAGSRRGHGNGQAPWLVLPMSAGPLPRGRKPPPLRVPARTATQPSAFHTSRPRPTRRVPAPLVARQMRPRAFAIPVGVSPHVCHPGKRVPARFVRADSHVPACGLESRPACPRMQAGMSRRASPREPRRPARASPRPRRQRFACPRTRRAGRLSQAPANLKAPRAPARRRLPCVSGACDAQRRAEGIN